MSVYIFFFFASRRRHTRCALVTGVQTCALPISVTPADEAAFAQWNATHPDDQREAVGAVDYVRDTYINIARRKVSGIDFGMAYKLPDTRFGDFSFKAAYARMNTFEPQRDAASPAISDLEMKEGKDVG